MSLSLSSVDGTAIGQILEDESLKLVDSRKSLEVHFNSCDTLTSGARNQIF